MRLIFLDDERLLRDVTWVQYMEAFTSVVLIRSYREFINFLENSYNEGDIFSFDHDIASIDNQGKEKTGYDCMKEMCEKFINLNISIPKCYVHSKNVVGAENIETYYNCAKNFQLSEGKR